ncbi:MAG: TonB-dependent receptor [Prevotella sp.]|nr:TonB-dependent receptor [Prevotella sp.]
MKKCLLFMLVVVLAASASAQLRVTGRVIDLQNKPVGDVIVKLMSGTKTLAYGSTNAKGEYVLEVKSVPSGTLTLQFNHISYEKETSPLPASPSRGGVVNQDMVLTPKAVTLKEVSVKADPLRQRGDTLSHNLASFLGKGDVTLEDGLKRLPGVDVSKNGGISYMGKPISQFNIEGLDMLGGKYNLATRNIPADYVTQVEIVRNHHARKVEKDVPSNEVSMNIKLSKKAKLKPFGQEEAGVGVQPTPSPSRREGSLDSPDANSAHESIQPPLPWGGVGGGFLLGLTGMMFTDKFQTICSLKGGNYKGFARADMYDHFGGSGVSTPATSLFGGFDGGAPPQGEYLYQRNGMASLNGIHKIDSTTTLKVNADYSYHRATHDISQSSTYLSGDGSYVTVSEQTSPLTKVHLPKLSVNYLKNADRVYLSETFVLKGKFEQNEGDVISSVALAPQQTEQRRKSSSFEVGNDLFWMGRTEKGTRRHVNASVAFRRTPTLRLSFVHDGLGYGQTAQSSTLSMNVGSSFSIPIGKVFRLSLPVRLNATYDDVETKQTHPQPLPIGRGEDSPITDVADIQGNYSSPSQGEAGERVYGWSLTPSLNPGFEIHSKNRRFYLSAGLGAALKGLYYNKLNYTKPVLNPSMGINYTFSANSKLSFSTGYSTSIGDMLTLLTEPMQVDYRTVRTSSGIIGESNSWGTSGEWKWQLPMQYFTLSVSASHNVTKRNTLTAQSISGMDISTSALQRDTRSRSTNFSVAATKNFPSLFAKLGADASYGFGDSEQAISSSEGAADIIKVRSNNYNLHGNASVTPVPWLELRCDIRYGYTESHPLSLTPTPNPSRGEGSLDTLPSEDATSNANQAPLPLGGAGGGCQEVGSGSVAIHIFPIATLDISLDYDHVRRQITTDTYKHMSLFNASVQYKWKRLILRLELDNLLNQRHYAYTVFDGINTYTYDYGLCGRTAMLRATFKL